MISIMTDISIINLFDVIVIIVMVVAINNTAVHVESKGSSTSYNCLVPQNILSQSCYSTV